jgi:5-formyltetrahydrofolate cyclo-ligase
MIQRISQQKKQWREQMLQVRDQIPFEERQHREKVFFEKVLQSPIFSGSKVIMSFASMGSELNTWGLMKDLLAAGKKIVLPRIHGEHLQLFDVGMMEQNLIPGVWGIKEPDPSLCTEISLASVDLVLVPGLAFDQAGYRLGYGKGFYDRLLMSPRPKGLQSIALIFEEQWVAQVPREAHDQVVDWIWSDQAASPLLTSTFS